MILQSDRWDRDFGSGSNLDQALQNQDRADRLDRVTPLPPNRERVTCTYTDAPEQYDGFGTRTVAIVGKAVRGPLRLVETPDEHVEWQRLRYSSGMYLHANREQIERLAQPPALVTLTDSEPELDPPVCRLQFPDGTVPGNAREAAEGWKRWADEFRFEHDRLKKALGEILVPTNFISLEAARDYVSEVLGVG